MLCFRATTAARLLLWPLVTAVDSNSERAMDLLRSKLHFIRDVKVSDALSVACRFQSAVLWQVASGRARHTRRWYLPTWACHVPIMGAREVGLHGRHTLRACLVVVLTRYSMSSMFLLLQVCDAFAIASVQNCRSHEKMPGT